MLQKISSIRLWLIGKTIVSDEDAVYDKVIQMDVSDLFYGKSGEPILWGLTLTVAPEIKDMNDERAYNYKGFGIRSKASRY